MKKRNRMGKDPEKNENSNQNCISENNYTVGN